MKRGIALLVMAAMGSLAAPAAGQAAPAGKLPDGVPRNGLVAFWTGDGHAKDSLGKHHGTAHGSATFTTGRHGKAKGAFGFNGKGGNAKIPDSAPLDTDEAFTLAAWINPSVYTDQHGNPMAIFAKWYQAERRGDYIFCVNHDGRLRLHVCAGPRVYELHYGRSVVPKNTWTHVAATFDRGTVKLHIKGRLDISRLSTKVRRLDPAEYKMDDLHIGALYNNANNFNGAIDEVGIWNRALSDVEIAGIAGPLAAANVTRLPLADRVETDDSTVLTGTIQNKKYALATMFGKMDLPATKVAGIARWRDPKATTRPTTQPTEPQVRVILADGQIVGGSLPGQKITLKTTQGSIATVPISSLVECGYRVTNTKPARPVPIGPAITLRDGQRLTISDAEAGGALQLRTDWGNVPVGGKSLLHVGPTDATGSRHRASFAGGSVLTGTLGKTLKVKLTLGLALTVDRSRFWQISGVAPPVDTGGATILLRNGDRLIGRFGPGTLRVRTKFGDMKIYARGIASMQVGPENPPRVTVRGWDGTNLAGSFVDAALAFEIGPIGPTVSVPPASILSAVNPMPEPPPEMLEKIAKLVAQLGAESYKDRQAAEEALVKMGKGIAGILKRSLKAESDPEIRLRLERITKAPGG